MPGALQRISSIAKGLVSVRASAIVALKTTGRVVLSACHCASPQWHADCLQTVKLRPSSVASAHVKASTAYSIGCRSRPSSRRLRVC